MTTVNRPDGAFVKPTGVNSGSSTGLVPADGEKIFAFLSEVYGNVPGLLEITYLSGKSLTPGFFPTSEAGISAAVSHILAVDQAEAPTGFYARATTVTQDPRTPENPYIRGGAGIAHSFVGFWTDLDFGTVGHADKRPGQLPNPADADAAQALYEADSFPSASVLANSGGGLYHHVLLDSPLDIRDEIDRKHTEKLSRRWHGKLKLAAQERGLDYGAGVANIDRLLRIPGTVNRKFWDNQRMCVAASTGIRHTAQELADFLPEPTVIIQAQGPFTLRGAAAAGSGLRPGDDFENKTDWSDILLPAGWTLVKNSGRYREWCRPGKNGGISATTGHADDRDRLYVFTESTTLPTWVPLTKFAAFAHLYCNGDMSAAARDLGKRGFGDPLPPRQSHDEFSTSPRGSYPDADAIPLDPREEDVWGGLVDEFGVPSEDPESPPMEGHAPPPWSDQQSRQRAEVGVLAPPSQPREVSKDIHRAYWMHEGKATLRHWRDQWMRWTGSHWEEITKTDLIALLYAYTGDATYTKVTKEETKNVPWNPTKSKIGNLEHALAALLNLSAKTETGAWIGNFDGSIHGTTIAVANGLLRVKDRRLAPHTPDFFNISSVPYDYSSQAQCPQWRAFLEDVFAHDPGAVGVLQEWFGYVLSGRTDLQKMFQIIGPKRSGKGTIARILQAVVGEDNCCGPQLSALTSDFGMTDLITSTLAVFGDARQSGRGTGEIVERLLSISGEDMVQINRKYRDPWQGRVPARLMLLSNITPNFGDDGGALPGRFISLTTVKDRSGREDITLESRLKEELAGILNWALEGLDRLEKTNRFSVTEAGIEILDMQNEGASPTKEFGTEMCVLDEDLEDENCWVTKTVLAAHFEAWTERNGYGEEGHGMRTNIPAFSRKIKAAFPWVKISNQKRRINGKQVPVYVGIKLTSQLSLLTPNPAPEPGFAQGRLE